MRGSKTNPESALTVPPNPGSTRRIFLLGLIAALALITLGSARAADESAKERKVLAGDGERKHIAIVNSKGELEWEYPIGTLHDIHMLPTGNILVQTNFQKLVEVSPDKKVVWSYDAGKMNGNEGKKVEVHAFQRLADGTTMIVESGPARILEVDAEGKIKKELKLKVNKPNAHSDTRLARKLANGNYLVSHEADGTIREYNDKGEVIWEFEVPLFDKKRAGGHGVEGFGNQTFQSVRLANGNTLISTGNGHSILEVTPAKEIVWHLKGDELPGIKLAWVTTLQVLPNGNIIFGNCHAGPENPQIIEITRDKKVVWTYKDFKLFGNSLSNSQVLGIEGDVIR